MKIYINAIQFKADQKLTDVIKKKMIKLEHFFDRVIEARVALKLENAGQIKDKVMEVRVKVPGDMIIVKETNKTFESALDDCVGTLKRQLIKYKERLRKKAS